MGTRPWISQVRLCIYVELREFASQSLLALTNYGPKPEPWCSAKFVFPCLGCWKNRKNEMKLYGLLTPSWGVSCTNYSSNPIGSKGESLHGTPPIGKSSLKLTKSSERFQTVIRYAKLHVCKVTMYLQNEKAVRSACEMGRRLPNKKKPGKNCWGLNVWCCGISRVHVKRKEPERKSIPICRVASLLEFPERGRVTMLFTYEWSWNDCESLTSETECENR